MSNFAFSGAEHANGADGMLPVFSSLVAASNSAVVEIRLDPVQVHQHCLPRRRSDIEPKG